MHRPSPISARRHADLARRLIAACGGLEESASACRIGVSTLSTYQNPREAATMPADVVVDLEAYCGDAIYSRAMCEARPSEPVSGDALAETHDVVCAASALLPAVMDMLAGKPGARARFADAVAKLDAEVDDVEAIASAGGAS